MDIYTGSMDTCMFSDENFQFQPEKMRIFLQDIDLIDLRNRFGIPAHHNTMYNFVL